MFNIVSLFPLIGAAFVLVLGFYVVAKDHYSIINRIFFSFSFIIFIFLAASAMLLSSSTEKIALFWEHVIYSAVVFIPSTAYRFSIIYRSPSNVRKIINIIGYVLSITFLLFIIFTDTVINGIYWHEWGPHAQAQPLHDFFMVFFLGYPLLVFWNFFYAYRHTSDKNKKGQFRILGQAFGVLGIGSIAFAPAYGIGICPPIAYTASILFVVTMAYAIFKYQILNTRVLAAQFFMVFIVLTSLIQVIIAQNIAMRLAQSIFFVIVTIFGYGVVQNVKENIKQRDTFEKMTISLKRANEQLIALDKQKSEMLSIAAHQLRTPLTAMNGYLSLVLEDTKNSLEGTTKEMITRVSRATNRLSLLVNNLLNMSRIDDGRMQYIKRPTHIDDVVQEIIETFTILAKEKGLVLIFDAPQRELPKIVVDENKMHEVFSNLINNAIKYTKEGKIVVKLWQYNEQSIRFSVYDTGVGIPDDAIGKLFNKFTRADRKEMNSEGAGLGLYVAYNIVHDHNGRIWAESDGEGKGATFLVELKIDAEEE